MGIKGALIAYTAYELKQAADTVIDLYQQLERDGDLTDEQWRQLATAVGVEAGGALIGSKLKILKAAQGIADKAGLSDLVDRLADRIKRSGNRIAIPSNLSKSLHDGGQGKHIVGHNNYDPTKGRSILTADARELLDGIHSGKYPIIRIAGDKPVVDFGKPIGTYGGNGPSTRYGTIHSGKNGAHIVPANPNQQ